MSAIIRPRTKLREAIQRSDAQPMEVFETFINIHVEQDMTAISPRDRLNYTGDRRWLLVPPTAETTQE